ncbi:RagB/SusD family nutrient uptake outer membrane protein [Abyssalbus ytuae]|uniref:RagB/SusD family nutrient uptake outer membrane protein n=1 Tax=Abyssalbus ytuae TaxID=2926907 RepID=A0A9E6ZIF2_9FLAO|nr:RagB/SusD family nutrient uptake outer membrane protein [Abyssalbus ytuae]UOB16109.1 RagB/SusD family nutrient uptake outer membrane protein [Abyssalbus ytuae]
MKHIINNINIKKSILLLCIPFILTSCDDYLEDELFSDTSVDFLYSTPEGLESAVVGLYTLNRNLYQRVDQNGAIPLLLQAKSDLSIGITGEISLYSRLSWGATLSDYGTRSGYASYWKHYYKLVDRANAIIQAAENLGDLEETQKNRIIAEAKVFRANSYFTLYRLFNNIFITTTPTNPDNAFDVPDNKSSEEEIFTLLESDLDFAIAHLDWVSSEFGRWNQAAARHLRAKVAMWEEDWNEAATQTDAIITNGSYSLVSNTTDVFKGDLNHSETLFAVQFERDVVGGGARSFMNWNLVPNYALAPGMVKSLENGGNGAGFVMPNDYLRNLLKEDPNDDRDDRSYYISYYYFNDAETLPEGKQLGDTLDLYDQNSSDKNEITNYYRRMNPGCIKFLDEEAVPTDRNHYKNIMIYRLAETYLIGAEAHMRSGNTAKALEYVNTVRNRAHASSISTINQQEILDERARELAFEGQRWFTLKRMGVLLSQLQNYMGNNNWNQTYATGDPRTMIQEHMKNWPIPEEQLNLLGPNYPQNEGY